MLTADYPDITDLLLNSIPELCFNKVRLLSKYHRCCINRIVQRRINKPLIELVKIDAVFSWVMQLKTNKSVVMNMDDLVKYRANEIIKLVTLKCPWMLPLLIKAAAMREEMDLLKSFVRLAKFVAKCWSKDDSLVEEVARSHDNTEIIRELLLSKCSKVPILNGASRAGHEKTVKLILFKGVSQAEKDDALVQAAAGGQLNTSRILINAGASVSSFTFMNACGGGNQTLCEEILLSHPELATVGTLNSALISACSTDKLNIVKYLIRLGANNMDVSLRVAVALAFMDIINYLRGMVTIRWDKIFSMCISDTTINVKYFADFLTFITEGIHVQKHIPQNVLVLIYRNEFNHTKSSSRTIELLSNVKCPSSIVCCLIDIALKNEDIQMMAHLLEYQDLSKPIEEELRKSKNLLALFKASSDKKRKRD